MFIFLALIISPWNWFEVIPGVDKVTRFYNRFLDWAVEQANANLFHVRKVLVPLNGSGDTSYGWAALWLFMSFAFLCCIIWSILDRKRPAYRQLNYWLCLFTRYYLAMTAFSYGILKLFAAQMPFPSESMLATPLGDLLPMRLSWMFIGYSAPYQIFSGVMEVFTGFLLLYRRTATLGSMMATAVFTNVMVLNLSYDIPVKIYSMELVFLCLFLLANEWRRIACFLVFNRPTQTCYLYDYAYTKRWMKITRIVLKIIFIGVFVCYTFYQWLDYSHEFYGAKEVKPIKPGLYDVPLYVVNHDTIPNLVSDTLRWQDVIFEKAGYGTIKTSDTAFRKMYRRARFAYSTDTTLQLLNISKNPGDSNFIYSMHYQMPDDNTIRLWGKRNNDSVYIELRKSNRHFQLAEKQFHWLSEANR